MTRQGATVRINVVVEIPTQALEAIVESATQAAGASPGGGSRVDTAGRVGDVSSRFLAQGDFAAFAARPELYR